MSTYLESLIVLAAILSLLTLGLNVRWGWAGEFDLAYYATVAMGAYFGSVVILPKYSGPAHLGYILGLHQPFLVALVAAGILGGVASLVIGFFALRNLRGDYLSIATVAFAIVAWQVLAQDPNLFDGFNGVYGMPQPFESVLKLGPDAYALFFFVMCVVLFLITYVILEMLYRSPFGRTLRAIREDEYAAAAFGRNVFVNKLKAYVIGGVVAGVGGCLFAVYLADWNPYVWAPIETFLIYGAIFIGGQANQRGITIGAIILLVAIPEVTRFMPNIPGHADLFPALRDIFSAILVILVLRFRPQGLIPEVHPRDPGDGQAAVAGSVANV